MAEHPFQPLINILTEVRCEITKLREAMTGLGSQPILTVHSPRSTNVYWGKFTVTTTPSLLRPARSTRLSISIVNSSGVSIYLGDDDAVSPNPGTAPGYELLSNSEFSSDSFVGPIYVVVAAGTADVTYWEEAEE